MRYLLDTNVCVDYLNGCYPRVIERLQEANPADVAVSAIAVAELRYGASKSSRPEANHHALDLFLGDVATLDFDREAATAYGALRTSLERSGTPIGPNDMLIAAQALAGGLILVSDNTDEFARVTGLRVETWRR
jgi:tRNA(fMet)-specific endonuclease VapC